MVELIIAKKSLTPEGLDQVRKIRSGMNKSRALVDLGSAQLEESLVTKRVVVKPVSVRDIVSGKILKFNSIREAYLYISKINKVSISTISRNIDTGKSVKGYVFSSLNNSYESS